jgi:two-component system OmpR family sensor kinase
VTLRTRLALAAGLLLAVIATVGYLLIGVVEASQTQQIDRQLRAAIPSAIVYGLRPVGSEPPPAPPRPLPLLKRDRAFTDIYVAAVTGSHRSVLISPAIAPGQAPLVPGVTSSPGKAIHAETVGSTSGSQRWRAVAIKMPGTPGTLLMAISLGRADATASTLRVAVLAAGLLVLAVLGAAGYWVARLGLRPIAEVTDVAGAISLGDRSRRVRPGRTGTEAAQLATAFNVMLDDQQGLEQRLRQFVADASHELRTPVSAIQGFAELWSAGHLRSGRPLEDAIRRVGQESSRMAALVEDLLLLARLDEGRPLDRDEVDLASLLHDAVVDASHTHPSHEVRDLTVSPVTVRGDEDALRQVVANLLANALTHTDPTSTVTVRAAREPGAVVIEVTDAGPGMDAAAAARAFDRFWRADASRSRPGSGLGLSIVAAVVAALGGQVTLETEPATGTTARVRLPV